MAEPIIDGSGVRLSVLQEQDNQPSLSNGRWGAVFKRALVYLLIFLNIFSGTSAFAQVAVPAGGDQPRSIESQLPDLPGAAAKAPMLPINKKQPVNSDIYNTTVENGYARERDAGGSDFKTFLSGQAGSKASSFFQDWLKRYVSTAKVELSGGDGFKAGSLDVLVPFSDTQEWLIFGQAGIRRGNQLTPSYRTTVNLGAGARYFAPNNWMYGANTFYDVDASRGHQRFGVGAEAWTDYLKLSANGYLRSSDWKDSPDVRDYMERPADGWDIRAQGYLPNYPQLGGNVMFEQYYGDQVGLFGATNRQKDPSALTVGFTFTPFPMLTFGVDHRRGQGGMHDTTLKLKFELAGDVPLKDQLNFRNLGESRKLKYSRYGLVERNNQIVLAYQQKDLGSIRLPVMVNGYPVTEVVVPITVNSSVPLGAIGWQGTAASFVTSSTNSSATLMLPAYDAAGSNTYTLQASATDRLSRVVKSNVSQVVVAPLALSLARSKAAASADGVDSITFTAKLLSTTAQPMPNRKITWTVRNAVLKASTTTTDAAGQATATVTSTTSSLAQVDAVEGSNSFKATADAAFVGDPATAKVVTLVSDQPSLVANGSTSAVLTATVKDAAGNAVGAGVPVTWSTSLGSLAAITTATNASGIANVTLTSSTVIGTANVTARAIVSDPGKATTVAMTADNTTARVMTFTANPTSIAANGATTSLLTATVQDANGNTVAAGVPVNWTTSLGTLAASSTMTNASGTATVVLTSSTVSGIANLSAKGATGDPGKNANVNFVPDTSTAKVVSFTALPSPVLANGVAVVTLTASVTDANGNTVGAGVPVSWTTTVGTLASASTTTNASGVATVALTSTVANTANLTAKASGVDAGQSATATFVADESTARVIAFAANPVSIAANGVTTSTLTATVKDANGNGLGAGVSVYWTTSLGTLATPSSVTDATGTATVVLTSATVAGTANLTAKGAVGDGGRTATVAMVPDVATARVVSLTASPTSIAATGATTSTLTANVQDAFGNVVGAGVPVAWTTSLGSLASASTATNASGVATVVLTSGTTIGVANLTAKGISGDPGKAATVTFTPDPATARVISFTAVPSPVLANGVDTVTLTAVVQDAFGNPYPAGVPVQWSASIGSLAAASTNTDATSTATVTLTSTLAGVSNLTAKGGVGDVGKTASVTFNADASTARVTALSASSSNIAANGSKTTTMTATVKDFYGNVVNGVTVNWSTTAGTVAGASSTSNSSGLATMVLTSSAVAQVANVVAAAANGDAGKTSPVTFSAAGVQSISASPASGITANGSSTSTITAVFAYPDGTPYVGAVSFGTSNFGSFQNGSSAYPTTTNASGGASALLKSTVVGTTNARAIVGAVSAQTPVTFISPSETRYDANSQIYTTRCDGGSGGNPIASGSDGAILWDGGLVAFGVHFPYATGGYVYTVGAFQGTTNSNDGGCGDDATWSYNYAVTRTPQ